MCSTENSFILPVKHPFQNTNEYKNNNDGFWKNENNVYNFYNKNKEEPQNKNLNNQFILEDIEEYDYNTFNRKDNNSSP